VQADQKIQKVDKSIAQSWPNVSSNADSQKKVSKKASSFFGNSSIEMDPKIN
jgi:hypothetical protein